jgi:hypothetical protein
MDDKFIELNLSLSTNLMPMWHLMPHHYHSICILSLWLLWYQSKASSIVDGSLFTVAWGQVRFLAFALPNFCTVFIFSIYIFATTNKADTIYIRNRKLGQGNIIGFIYLWLLQIKYHMFMHNSIISIYTISTTILFYSNFNYKLKLLHLFSSLRHHI